MKIIMLKIKVQCVTNIVEEKRKKNPITCENYQEATMLTFKLSDNSNNATYLTFKVKSWNCPLTKKKVVKREKSEKII